MAWDEWDSAKADVTAQRQASMRLNQLPGGPGGSGQVDLVVNQDDLGAVGHEAFMLHSQLHKETDIAGAGADKEGPAPRCRQQQP